ncbi:peptidase U32 family protein [Paenibacillus senegalensis]|uniref:peptidase U32 family protein n=1 Tax=Paenibacillus senegalensis TaxID=1465766 RepID=UPI000288C5B2|nr:peptidase U32 family protein [Paenibacillus senegalensis]
MAIKKPELLVTAGSLEEIRAYIKAGATAVQIGEARYGMRLPGDITRGQLKEAVQLAHDLGGKLYIVANNIMSNEVLDELPDYLRSVQDSGADALVFGDPAVLISMKQAGVQLPLHWNPEMTATNYATANYWASKGAVRFVLARELNEQEIHEIKANTAMEVELQVHGMTNIFHSKRRMVSAYQGHLGADKEGESEGKYGVDKQMILIEAERQEEKYPVYEDVNGTHIMSSDDLCLLEIAHELIDIGIDSFKVESFMKSREYVEAVLRIYRMAIDAYSDNPSDYECREEWLEALQEIQPKDRELSFGFMFKEQVY